MKIYIRFTLILFAVTVLTASYAGHICAADDEGSMSIDILPVRIIDVDGDTEKFRAHTWMNDGYAGGINNLSIKRLFDDNTSMTFDMHSLPDANDHAADLLINREGLGAMTLHYQMFKKYFDHSGGYYFPFTSTFESSESAEDLNMDIGNLLLEFSPALESLHDITFSYEHHTKNGIKSRLTWAEVVENSVAREIAPSWQDIDEVVDTIAVKGKTDLGGFSVEGEQSYEITKIDTVRTEKFLSDTAGSGRKIRTQTQEPEAIALTTVLKGEKWFDDDKSFLALAYRFHQINNKESENIVETDENGTPTNAYSHPKQIADSSAENKLNSHSWVAHYMTSPWTHLNFSVKSKVQMVTKDGASDYNADTGGAAPDGVIDDQNLNDTKSKLYKFGENFGFRYTGLPRTSIYGDFEVGYMRNNLSEEENDESGAKTWFRETDTDTQEMAWTLGGRYAPSKVFNMTAHLRRNQEINDYDDQDESASINSAFFEELRVVTHEATTKMTWKARDWLQNSLRYQYLHKRFDARIEEIAGQKAISKSHVITLDSFLQPKDSILMNFSISHQFFTTLTSAAADTSVSRAPQFDADVTSLLFSTSYTPNEELSFIGITSYSFSDNFDDFTDTALPLAVTNSRFYSELGLKWAPKDKDWSLEPKYAYYDYSTHSESELGDYQAHVGWLDVSYNW